MSVKMGYLLTILFVVGSFQVARGQMPRNAQEYNTRGLLRQSQGDLDGAIEHFTKAIERANGLIQVIGYNNRANARMGKSDWDGAIADYTRSLDIQLDNNREVPVEIKRDNNEGSAGVFTGVTIAPPVAFTYNNRGNARKAKGDIEGAIADYNQALETNPRYTEAYYNRGIALQSKGDLGGAIRDYSTALELAPSFTDAYINRGQAKQAKDDLEGALADYNAALQLKSDDASIYFARASALQAKKDLAGALA